MESVDIQKSSKEGIEILTEIINTINEQFEKISSNTNIISLKLNDNIEAICILQNKLLKKNKIFCEYLKRKNYLINIQNKIENKKKQIIKFIKYISSLEDDITAAIYEEPRIRGSISTSAIFATSVDTSYFPNRLLMQPSTNIQTKNIILDKNEKLLQELQKPQKEIDFENLLILSAHTARTCNSPNTLLTKPLPNIYIKLPAPHPYSFTLSRLAIKDLYKMVQDKDPTFGYTPGVL